MKKIIYTHGKLSDCGAQILIRAVPEVNSGFSAEDQEFLKRFPEVKDVITQVYESSSLAIFKDAGDPPRLGDVVWVETGGGKLIANCVIFDRHNNINLKAVDVCLRSVKTKIELADQTTAGMNLFGAELFEDEEIRDAVNRWRTIVPLVEKIFDDIQLISFVSDIQLLDKVLNSLPGRGDIQATCNGKMIRFRRHAQDNDK